MNALSLAKGQVFLFLFSLFSMLFLKEPLYLRQDTFCIRCYYYTKHYWCFLPFTANENILSLTSETLRRSSRGAAKVFRWLCGPSNTIAILKSPQNTTSVFNSVIQCTKQDLSRFKKKKIQHSLNNKIIVPHGRRCWSMLQSDLSTRQHSGKKKIKQGKWNSKITTFF